MVSQSWGRSVCPPPHRSQREIPGMILSEEEKAAVETVESEGG